MVWLPIRYRDFYDVPRVFVADHQGTAYLFDCPFDAGHDEYDRVFHVYQLSADALPPREGPWEGTALGARFVGHVQVSDVVFDATRRTAIEASVFGRLQSGDASSDV